ncbi:MAG: phosphoribosylaminoimidazolesuccinocarboxamide synthase [Bacillota bacterium]
MSDLVAGKDKLYEGKAKVVYPGDPGEVYMVFKDSATAFNGEKKGTIKGKGFFNAHISTTLFKYLEKQGVPTHFISLADEVTMKCKRLRIFPIEVVVRNIVAGSLSKRTGKPEGVDLPFPILELYYKSDELGDPLLNDDHILAFGFAAKAELDHLRDEAKRINAILMPFFRERGLLLVDFKLEFGRVVSADGSLAQTVLGDEISPDTCRFWDATTREKLDKDRFRRDLGGVEEAYAEVLRRVSQ